MIEIKRHGSFLETDREEFVVPVDQSKEIQPKWRLIVNDVIEFHNRHLDGVINIYVRGSVAKGIAVEEVSDKECPI